MSIHTGHSPSNTRHVGTCGDKRVAVIIQDPEATHEVHVVDTDSLPDAYHQNIMDMLMRPEAQSSKWFGEYLHRQMLFDGTNALRQLYERNWIQQVPTTSVTLTPRPNQQIPLTQELGIMVDPSASHRQYQPADVPTPSPQQYNPLANNTPNTVPQTMDDIVRAEQAKLDESSNATFNQHTENLRSDVNAENELIASNIMEEVKMLEAEALRKRAAAAQYDPRVTAIPTVPTVPSPTVPPLMQSIAIADTEFVDQTTGKSYATAAALKGAQTRRDNAAKKTG